MSKNLPSHADKMPQATLHTPIRESRPIAIKSPHESAIKPHNELISVYKDLNGEKIKVY